jgi:hypothetical protein
VANNASNYNTQLNNCYIGHNTFIAGEKTIFGVNISENQQGRPFKDSLFENNIILGPTTISAVNGDISGIAFRNNLWSTLPVAAVRGPGDRVGDPNLVNPTTEITHSFPNPNTTIDPVNYQLTSKSSLAIAHASDGNALNRVQPPVVTMDFFGVTRDKQPDIGAHEYAGPVTQLAAGFSIGPGQEAGVAPHTVDFTDKSASDRPIVSRVWDFGDGATSTEVNPSHTYTSAGDFEVSLTVTDDQGNNDSHIEIELIAVSEMSNPFVPGIFRRFILIQIADNAVIAYGIQFPDLRCVVFWNGHPLRILNFDAIEDVEKSTIERGKTGLLWIDPSDQEVSPFGNIEPDPVEEPAPTWTSYRG